MTSQMQGLPPLTSPTAEAACYHTRSKPERLGAPLCPSNLLERAERLGQTHGPVNLTPRLLIELRTERLLGLHQAAHPPSNTERACSDV